MVSSASIVGFLPRARAGLRPVRGAFESPGSGPVRREKPLFIQLLQQFDKLPQFVRVLVVHRVLVMEEHGEPYFW